MSRPRIPVSLVVFFLLASLFPAGEIVRTVLSKPLPEGIDGPSGQPSGDRLSLPPISTVIGQDSTFGIQLSLRNFNSRSGLQTTVSFDPTISTPVSLVTTSRASTMSGAGMGVIENGSSVILLFDATSNTTIAADSGAVCTIS